MAEFGYVFQGRTYFYQCKNNNVTYLKAGCKIRKDDVIKNVCEVK